MPPLLPKIPFGSGFRHPIGDAEEYVMSCALWPKMVFKTIKKKRASRPDLNMLVSLHPNFQLAVTNELLNRFSY